MHPVFSITGLFWLLFLLGFAVTSFLEKERRASAMALAMATICGSAWFFAGIVYPAASFHISIAFWAMLTAGLRLLAWPFGKPDPLEISPSQFISRWHRRKLDQLSLLSR